MKQLQGLLALTGQLDFSERARARELVADPAIAPADVRDLVADYAPRLAADLERARRESRAGARLELEPIHE